MAYGDIAPGSHGVHPGADPQVRCLEYLDGLPDGDTALTSVIAKAIDFTGPRCRDALKILERAGLVRSAGTTRRGELSWALTAKGYGAVRRS